MLRNPVVSISVRVWIGIQKMFAMPGVLMFALTSARSFSHVIPFRHSLGGLSGMIVSNMDNGAGSVGVSACPALPNTVTASGIFLNYQYCICILFVTSVIDIHWSAVGMYSN